MSDIRRLCLRPAGMFSNVNEVVQQLYLAEQGDYRFLVDWRRSCYASEERREDPWEYYFEQPFGLPERLGDDLPVLLGGAPVACTRDNIITPRERDGECAPLLLPENRALPNRIIDRYIRLRRDVWRTIESFRERHFQGAVIGLHIRGAGRTDGGVPGLRQGLRTIGGVPLPIYFDHVDEVLGNLPEATIFVASDSEFVISKCRERFGRRVVVHESQRSAFGEMHVPGKPENRGLRFDRPGLGLEVLTEAYLLAATDVLVHGNSNLVNFVLCLNPALDNRYVYARKGSGS